MKQKKIKILFIITGLDIGGAELLLLNMMRNINREKFDCTVLYLKGEGELKKEFENLELEVIDNSIYSFLNPVKYLKLYQLIKIKKIDILHSHLIHSNFIGRLIGKVAGVKVIINSEHNTSNWKNKNFLFQLLFKITFKYVDTLHCISNSVKNSILSTIKIDENKIKVIYNGICIDRFKGSNFQIKLDTDTENSFPIIGCVSRLDKRKGIEYLIKAVALLKPNFNNIKLIIVGDGDQRNQLIRLVEELNLKEHVVLTGKTVEVEKYLTFFNVFVLPSLQEGLSIAIIEAMAAGIPVVASKTGGIPEVIENHYNGILVKEKDEKAIAEAIHYIINNEEVKNKFISNAKNIASDKFDIKEIIKEFEYLYLELYSQKNEALIFNSY